MGLDPANTVVIEITEGDFPGGPVVKTPHFQCRDAGGAGVIPGRGTNIPHAARCSQKKKKEITENSQRQNARTFFPLVYSSLTYRRNVSRLPARGHLWGPLSYSGKFTYLEG